MVQYRMTPVRRPFIFVVTTALCALCSCQSSTSRPAPDAATAEGWDPSVSMTDSSAGMTRQQLNSEVRRFALRFAAKTTGFFESVREQDLTPDERLYAVRSQARANNAAMTIAIGDNPVANLLDMLALTTLARIQTDNLAVDMYGDARAAQLVEILQALESDIWGLADSVLTEQQQEKLKSLIADGRPDNFDLRTIWLVRFESFSGADAAEVEALQRSGGLVSQFARTVDTAEALTGLGERLLFYMEFAPFLFSLQAQYTAYEIMRQPEVQESVTSANNMARVIEQLPDTRLEFIDQLLEGIAVERAALLNGIVNEQASISQLLTDLKPVLESTVVLTANVNEIMQSAERTAVAVNLDMGGESAELDIGAYRQLVIESATTVVELRQLVESLDTLAQSRLINDGIPPAFLSVREEIDYLLHRFFVLLGLTIVGFFGALFLYRHGRYRYHSTRT
jgi:hypothetical protein